MANHAQKRQPRRAKRQADAAPNGGRPAGGPRGDHGDWPASKVWWQFALEGAKDGVWTWDVPTNRASYSRQGLALLGYDEQEIGDTLEEWDQRVHPDDKARSYDLLERHLRGETEVYENEHRIRCKDGNYRWFLARGKVVERTTEGQPRQIIGTFSDINARKQAEERLRTLYFAIEHSNSTVLITDTQGRIEYVNPHFTAATGYTPAEVMGQNPRVLKSGEMPTEGYRQLWETIQSGNQWRGEFHNKRKDGTLYWESASIAPIRNDEGQITHFVAIKEDITERKRMEFTLRCRNHELEAARAELGQLNQQLEARVQERTREVERLLMDKQLLIDQLGHDLKTPLSPLLSLLPLLLAHESDAHRKQMLNLALDGARSIHVTLRRMLELCRVTAPDRTLNLTTRPLRHLVDMALAANHPEESLMGRIITNEVSESLVAQVDESLLLQAFEHVLDNAVKFTAPDGHIAVRAELQGRQVVVTVADNGQGMEAPHLLRAFDPFYKADASRHDRSAPGLGLAITRAIVERHGGRIWAESGGAQKGTLINFALPAANTGDTKKIHEETRSNC